MYGRGSNMEGRRNNTPCTPEPMPRRKTVEELMEEYRKEWEIRDSRPVVIPDVPSSWFEFDLDEDDFPF